MRNMKRKMMAMACATTTMGMMVTSTTFAKEKTIEYTISSQKEDMNQVLKEVFSKKVGDMKYKKTETKVDKQSNKEQEVTTYESNKYRVEVIGLDMDQEGQQEVTFLLTNKTVDTSDQNSIVLNSEALQSNNRSSVVAADSGVTIKQEAVIEVQEEKEKEISSQDKASIIAQAALSQIGVYQDCTMLVSNSLAAVGINFHGWPEDYLSLGQLTDNPVPGDIIVYSGHVAIYIGDGQAVHGGWNGNQTQIYSVQCSNALIGYVHVA